jgi:hypothetical protein
MADLDPIALAAAIAEAQSKAEKPSVASRIWTAIAGSDADPNIPSAVNANLGLSPSESARMVALLATTRNEDRLKSGILKIEPETTFGTDESGRMYAMWPRSENGKKTGALTRFYPNEPGLGMIDVMQAAGAVGMATPVGRGLAAIGLPTAGLAGAAAIGGTEAALVEAGSSQMSGAPYQVTDIPIGAFGGAVGQKLINIVGSLVNTIRRLGPTQVLGPDGRLLPGPAKMVRDAGLNPDQVSASVAAQIQKQVTAGVAPEAAAVTAMSQGLPTPVPMTQGQLTGSAGQQLAEDAMSKGVYGALAEKTMQTFRTGQQTALRENVTGMTEALAPGGIPISKGEGGKLAQEALAALRAGDKARSDALYAQARASGAAAIEPTTALNIADTARSAYREGFSPTTAPKMDELLLRLDEIMANGGDIKMLNQWRTQVSNLRAGVPDVEGAAAGAVLRSVDANIKNAVDNQLLIGDQTAVDAWRNAITNYADYAKTWKDKGGILNLLTETSVRDGSRQLKVAPESAANAIFTMTASGLASKTGLPRDLLTLKAKLPTEQWDQLRQEAFIRLTETLEKVGTGGAENVSGLAFKSAWKKLLENNPGVVNTLFSKAERDTITQFADVAARATSTVVNASNSANSAAGIIQRLGSMFRRSAGGQFILENYLLGKIIAEPYGQAAATMATAGAKAPTQIVGTSRAAAVGAGAGAALSQEEQLGPRIPLVGRMTIGGQQ